MPLSTWAATLSSTCANRSFPMTQNPRLSHESRGVFACRKNASIFSRKCSPLHASLGQRTTQGHTGGAEKCFFRCACPRKKQDFNLFSHLRMGKLCRGLVTEGTPSFKVPFIGLPLWYTFIIKEERLNPGLKGSVPPCMSWSMSEVMWKCFSTENSASPPTIGGKRKQSWPCYRDKKTAARGSSRCCFDVSD